MPRAYVTLLLLPVCVYAQTAEWKESAPLAQLFKQEGVSGTFIVHDVSADVYTVHDGKRAQTRRYIPASTYKIQNSLIGLSTSAVASVDEVPIYREPARRTDMVRMHDGLRKPNDGNVDPSPVAATCWPERPLKVSALDQTMFLDQLAQDQLPFPKREMAALQEITRLEGPADLHAKTGWGSTPNEPADIGWWVGWVKKDGKLYTFALNLDITDDASAAKRVPLGKAGLHALGLL